MERPERRVVVWFWIRVALLLAVSLSPLPWVADTYSTCFATTMNPVLATADRGLPVELRFEAPERLRVRGPWTVPLLMQDRDSKEAVLVSFDFRSLSYRPIMTFLILALASPLGSPRRKALVLGLGLLLMGLITTFAMALPIATTLSIAGVLGGDATRSAIQTAGLALETPVMMYFIPTLVWWLLLWRTRPTGAAW